MVVKTDWTAGDVLTANQVRTYLANSGLVYVTQQDIEYGTSTSFTDVFSSEFHSYLVVIQGLSSAYNQTYDFQFEDSGGTPVTTNYNLVGGYRAWGSSSLTGFTDTQWGFPLRTGHINTVRIEIQQPWLDRESWMQAEFCTDVGGYWVGGRHTLETSYSSFRLTAAQNFTQVSTGGVFVYGYRRA